MSETTTYRSRRRQTNKGGVIVETALIFLAFSCLLIGTFDFGQFLFIHQALVERVRYAARWGAINNPADSTSITNMILYNQSTAPSGGTAGYFGLTSSNIAVSNPDSGTIDHRLNVHVSGYSYTMLSPYIGGTYTGPPISVTIPLGLY